ncbi:MAG TPA: hypothetical protein VHT31_09130, partial [Candidatus Acidoferrum sp.]|nr:hypothetical protein [Candidatus Acidoferrum sp.]
MKDLPDSDRVFGLRRYLVCVIFVAVYLAADRSTVFLQIWPGIRAWYPPTRHRSGSARFGNALRAAVYVGGAAGRKSELPPGDLHLHLPVGKPLIFSTYTLAAKLLRDVLKIDWPLASILDVMV